MFSKLPSKRVLPKAKEVNILIKSQNITTKKRASENTNPITSTLNKSSSGKSSSFKNKTINKTATEIKSFNQITIKPSKDEKQLSNSNKLIESKTPPRLLKHILGHHRSNSEGQYPDDRYLCRNRSTSSLFNDSPAIKQIDLVRQFQLKCQQLLLQIKTVLPRNFNVYNLSYENICHILYELQYINMSTEEQFINQNLEKQLGIIYKFWINLTNSHSASLQNLLLLLLHIEGIALKYPKIQDKVKKFVELIAQEQQPKNITYKQPQYRFIGLQSISSWTNTGRLVIHKEQSIKLQNEFISIVNNKMNKNRIEETTPIKKFYENSSQCLDNLLKQSGSKSTYKTKKFDSQKSITQISSQKNIAKKRNICDYRSSLIESNKIRLKNKEDFDYEKLCFSSRNKNVSYKRIKTQPNSQVLKQSNRSLPISNIQSLIKQKLVPKSTALGKTLAKSSYRHRRVKSDEPVVNGWIPVSKTQRIQTQVCQKKIPIIYIDVNLDNSHKQTLAIFEKDRSQIIASEFAVRHGLDKQMQQKLKQLIDAQLTTILHKIDEEYQQEDTPEK